MTHLCGASGDGVSSGFHIGLWRSLEAHLLWEQGVVSSNLTSPTNEMNPCESRGFVSFYESRAITYSATTSLRPWANPSSVLVVMNPLFSSTLMDL